MFRFLLIGVVICVPFDSGNSAVTTEPWYNMSLSTETTTHARTTSSPETTTNKTTTLTPKTTTIPPTTTRQETTTKGPTTLTWKTTAISPTTLPQDTTTKGPTTLTWKTTAISPTTLPQETTTKGPTTLTWRTTMIPPTTSPPETTTNTSKTLTPNTTTIPPTTTFTPATTTNGPTTLTWKTTTIPPTAFTPETTTNGPTTYYQYGYKASSPFNKLLLLYILLALVIIIPLVIGVAVCIRRKCTGQRLPERRVSLPIGVIDKEAISGPIISPNDPTEDDDCSSFWSQDSFDVSQPNTVKSTRHRRRTVTDQPFGFPTNTGNNQTGNDHRDPDTSSSPDDVYGNRAEIFTASRTGDDDPSRAGVADNAGDYVPTPVDSSFAGTDETLYGNIRSTGTLASGTVSCRYSLILVSSRRFVIKNN